MCSFNILIERCNHLLFDLASILHSVRERASARTELEESVPVEGTRALNRAPNSEDFHKK